jgi:hypothetical protein
MNRRVFLLKSASMIAGFLAMVTNALGLKENQVLRIAQAVGGAK